MESASSSSLLGPVGGEYIASSLLGPVDGVPPLYWGLWVLSTGASGWRVPPLYWVESYKLPYWVSLIQPHNRRGYNGQALNMVYVSGKQLSAFSLNLE